MKQTAVEWLWDMLLKGEFINDPEELFERAKQMEREQIIKSYNQDLYGGLRGEKQFDDGEDYYNETFNNQKP